MANPSTSPPVFSLEKISKSFGARHVLRSADLAVQRGERVVVLGGSGSGKSVLLRILLGFISPEGGLARVFGALPPYSPFSSHGRNERRLGVLFQNDALLEERTVEENILLAFPPEAMKDANSLESLRGRCAKLAARAGLSWEAIARLRPAQLSGGMRKRVALIRAVANSPEALLVDEPTAGLDLRSSRQIVELLAEHTKGGGMACLIITHDLDCARALADRVVFLDRGKGRFTELDPATLDSDEMERMLGEESGPNASFRAGETDRARDWRGVTISLLGAVGHGVAAALEGFHPPRSRDLVRRFREILLGSFPLVVLVFLIMGMTILLQARSALAPMGMHNLLPQVLAEAGLKLAPFLVGVMLAGRVGSGICAEMGLLRQTDQLDAMRVLGLPPERRLLSPWLWGALAAFPLLTMLSEGVAALGATLLLASSSAGEITTRYLWSNMLDNVNITLFVAGLVKAGLFGLVIAMCAYFFGAREGRGAGAVGRSITMALVASFVLIVVLDFVVSLMVNAL